MEGRLSSNTKVIIGLTVALLLVAGAVVAGIAIFRSTDSAKPATECVASGTSGAKVELSAVNLQHASTINAVGIAKGLSQRARVIAIATAYQESTLRNLPTGDRDSVGLFQQRTSQGWGTVDQIMDPIYSAGIFYDHLVEVAQWERLSLTDAAQAVQRSAYPDAYAKWEDEATILVTALSGTRTITLNCRVGATPSNAAVILRQPIPGSADLKEPLERLLSAAQAELGGLTLVGYLTDGASATVSIALPGVKDDQAARILASWFLAHEATTPLVSISVQGREWSEHRWRDASASQLAGQVTVVVAP